MTATCSLSSLFHQKWRGVIALAIPLFFIIFGFSVHVNATIVCGGFIKLGENVSIDRSTVKLSMTKVGESDKQLIDTDPFGAWYAPIDDDGEYIIEPSTTSGIILEPKFVKVTVLKGVVQEKDVCTEGKDIVFTVSGFGVSGKIVPPHGCSGLCKDITKHTITLREKITKKEISKVSPSSDGSIFFEKIPFGTYEVIPSFPTPSIPVVTIDGKPLTPFTLTLSYKISGSLQTSETDGYANAVISMKNVKTGAVLTSKVSDKYTFSFVNIPCGKYQISATYENDGTKYTVSPSALTTEVTDMDVTLSPFIVKGFTAHGSTNANDFLADNELDVLLLKKDSTTTQHQVVKSFNAKDGKFTIEQIEEGEYDITLRQKGLLSSELSVSFEHISVKLSPANTVIPMIHVIKAPICGAVKYLDDGSQKHYETNVIVTDAHGKIIVSTTASPKTSRQQKYCILAPVPDDTNGYFISTTANGSESVLEPKNKLLNVQSFQKGVNFVQSISTLTVELDTAECEKVTISLFKSRNAPFATKELPCAKGQVKFTIPSSSYRIVVSGTHLCFAMKDEYDIQESQTITLRPEGFRFTLTSKQPITANVCRAEQNTDCKPVLGGKSFTSTSVCIDKDSVVQAAHADYIYAPQTVTPSKDIKSYTLSFTPSGVKLTGRLKIDDADIANGEVTIRMTPEPATKTIAKPARAFSKSYPYYEYTAIIPYGSADNVIAAPVSENNVMFSPQKAALNKGSFTFQDITAYQGVYLTGSTNPSTSDVTVTVTGGGLSAPISTKTHVDGTFSVGLVSRKAVAQCKVHMDKPSYTFEKLPSSSGTVFNFSAKKISSIRVKTATAAGTPIPGVIVALSSDKGSRVTSTTNELGVAQIPLPPAGYYVSVALKEYAFEPKAKQIQLSSAEEGLFTAVGKRVRYHISGTVATLDGNALPCKVQAVNTATNEVHTATTTATGAFVIRGLKPNTTYTVSVDDAGVVASLPESRLIALKEQDEENVKFVGIVSKSAAKTAETTTVKGYIRTEVTPTDAQKSPEVRLCGAGKCVIFSDEEFFTYRTCDVEDGTYTLEARMDKAQCACQGEGNKNAEYHIHGGAVYDAEGKPTSVVAVCECKVSSSNAELSVSSAMGIIFFAVIIVVYANKDKLLALIAHKKLD